MGLLIFDTSDWFCQAVRLILLGSLTNFEIGISYLSVQFCAMWCLSVGCLQKSDGRPGKIGQTKIRLILAVSCNWPFRLNRCYDIWPKVNQPNDNYRDTLLIIDSASKDIVNGLRSQNRERTIAEKCAYWHDGQMFFFFVFLSIWPTDMASSPKVILHVRFQRLILH